jgi:hypothetical protein
VIFPLSKNAIVPKSNAAPLPPMWKQAINYGKAQALAVERAFEGKPVLRSREETIRLVEHFCKGHGAGEICGYFRFSDGKCAKCGCPVGKRAGRAGLGCPIGKFQ